MRPKLKHLRNRARWVDWPFVNAGWNLPIFLMRGRVLSALAVVVLGVVLV